MNWRFLLLGTTLVLLGVGILQSAAWLESYILLAIGILLTNAGITFSLHHRWQDIRRPFANN